MKIVCRDRDDDDDGDGKTENIKNEQDNSIISSCKRARTHLYKFFFYIEKENQGKREWKKNLLEFLTGFHSSIESI